MLQRARSIPPAVGALCVLAVIIAAAVASGPLQGVPHVTDEIAYTLQSRLFASGLRTGPAVTSPWVLETDFWVTTPTSHAVFPPGWPALLAVGEIVGAPWSVNALLAGCLPLLTWLLARSVAPRAAVYAAGVTALSPGVWILAASRMAHTSCLVALLVGVVVVTRAWTGARDRAWAWAAAGGATGYLVLARPFEGVLLGGAVVLGGVLRAGGLRSAAALCIPPVAAGLLVLADNAALTGDALRFPANAWFDAVAAEQGRAAGCNRLGFGVEIGCRPTLGSYGHSLGKAWRHSLLNLERLDKLLLGVTGGGLTAAAGLLFVGRRGRRIALLGLLPVVGYALYWSPGAAYGARFWHSLYVALPLLVGATLSRIPGRWGWALLVGLPLASAPAIIGELGDRFWCVSGDAQESAAVRGIERGLVFYQAAGVHEAFWPSLKVALDCTSGLTRGELLLMADPAAPDAGVQPRSAPPDADTLTDYVRSYPAQTPAHVLQHEVASGRQRWLRVTDGGLQGMGEQR